MPCHAEQKIQSKYNLGSAQVVITPAIARHIGKAKQSNKDSNHGRVTVRRWTEKGWTPLRGGTKK